MYLKRLRNLDGEQNIFNYFYSNKTSLIYHSNESGMFGLAKVKLQNVNLYKYVLSETLHNFHIDINCWIKLIP